MELTRNFTKLNKNDADIAGGKGASLGEMTQAGIPVPPGFVILSTTFDEFIKESKLNEEIDAIIDEVNHKEISSVEYASEKIQTLIKNATMPKVIAEDIIVNFTALDAEFVAVRSSATAEDGAENAWAGQLDSYLNTKEDNLLLKVQHCWASLFTPRAIFYRFEKGLHNTKISVAVVVQKMVNSEISGIAFSVHPVTEDRNQLIIEAGFGLGEAIVSGSVTPDSYVVEKEPRKIIDITASTQERALYRLPQGGNEWKVIPEPQASSQVLTEEQILEFSGIILGIENHYGFPCDIEWAFEEGKFYIVQSRPITTLSNVEKEKIDPMKDISQWRFWGRWQYPVLGNAPWHYTYTTEAFKKINLPNEFTGDAVDMDGYAYAKESDHKLFDIFALDKFYHDPKWFDNFFSVCEDSVQSALKAKTIKELMVAHENIVCCSFIVQYCDKAFESEISKLINEAGISSDDAGKVLVPSKDTNIMQYQKGLASLKENEIDSFLKKYQWIGANYMSGKRLTKEDIMKERGIQYNHIDSFDLNSLSESFRNQIEIAQNLIYYRSINAETLNKSVNGFWEEFDEIASKFNKTREDFNRLTTKEVGDLGEGKDLPADFEARTDRNGMASFDRHFTLYFGDELDEQLKTFEHRAESADSVKGTIAYKGAVSGVARIIEKIEDLQKVNHNDIIVANETMPDYIIGMRKAAAFVTNQGGITSHAAIVARELKKPCIIGTKVATKIFKDGDIIEVDANRGIVRIIK